MDEKNFKENKFVAWTPDPTPCEDTLRASDFADTLKEVMENREMSQAEVSRKAGITETAMSRYCSGKRLPNTRVLVKLAEAMDVPIDLLVGRKRNLYSEIVSLRHELNETNTKLGKALLENESLRQMKFSGSAGICRAKLKGNLPSKWHIGNVICTEDGRAYILIEDHFTARGAFLTFGALEVDPETIQRFACVEDMTGNRLFEGDVIYNPEHKSVRMEICYGKYAAYCPNDQEYMENVGFFVVTNTTEDALPLGKTEEYALLLGNVIDNPDIKVV